MEKVVLALAILGFAILGFALKCSATVYTVGDSSGWDISTDLDDWEKGKTFLVGDVLLFQYSSIHSLDEVTGPDYEGCNTTSVLQSSRNGNTSIPLANPGDRYFVCGNRLHCLGGMKLHVHVRDNQAGSPASAPQGQSGGSLPQGSTRSNNPLPSSAVINHPGIQFVFVTILCLSCFLVFGMF